MEKTTENSTRAASTPSNNNNNSNSNTNTNNNSNNNSGATITTTAQIPEPTVINWTEAMTQVGGEIDFLEEVLQDLLDEAKTAEDDIKEGIDTKDFDKIMKAAHRIKGSATYLGCEALRITAYAIQQLGHDGTKGVSPGDLWIKIDDEYALFLTALSNLRTEIARWKAELK